jgi:hypothetical protein
VSGSGMMDGAIFFTMLFGSDRFAGLIGELYCAATARLSGTPGSEIALERAQMARVAGLAEKCVVDTPPPEPRISFYLRLRILGALLRSLSLSISLSLSCYLTFNLQSRCRSPSRAVITGDPLLPTSSTRCPDVCPGSGCTCQAGGAAGHVYRGGE